MKSYRENGFINNLKDVDKVIYYQVVLNYFVWIYRKAMKRAHLQGSSFGLSEAFMFIANAVAFWYGGKLVSDDEMNMEQVMK